MLSLGVVKRLQKPYVATFYQKVVDLVSGIEAEDLVDSVSVFVDTVSEFTNSLRGDIEAEPKEVEDAFHQLELMWSGTHRIFQGFARSNDPAEALMATKALALLKRYRLEPLKRTNVVEQFTSLTSSITSAWTSTELDKSFLQLWSDRLITSANNFASLYQRRVQRTTTHVSVSQYSGRLFDQFYFLFYDLYVYVGKTGDVAVSEIFECIKELIDIYGRIHKAHATRVANRNRTMSQPADGQPNDKPSDETQNEETSEIDALLRQAAAVGRPTAEDEPAA